MNIIGVITMLMVAGPHAYWLFTKRGVRSVGLLFAFTAVSLPLDLSRKSADIEGCPSAWLRSQTILSHLGI